MLWTQDFIVFLDHSSPHLQNIPQSQKFSRLKNISFSTSIQTQEIPWVGYIYIYMLCITQFKKTAILPTFHGWIAISVKFHNFLKLKKLVFK